jgi:hypothetical protein
MGTAYRPSESPLRFAYLPISIFLLKIQHVGWAKCSVPIILVWIWRMDNETMSA